MRPGSDPKKYMNLAKIDLSTGEMRVLHSQPQSGNGSALVTAGDVVFWGDQNRRLRAFDADDGKILWETIVGGMVKWGRRADFRNDIPDTNAHSRRDSTEPARKSLNPVQGRRRRAL